MTRFIGRARELEALQEAYASNRAELVVVYGRRRLGKTSLLTQFCADKPSVFYPAKLQSNTMQLQDFSAMLKNAGAPLLQIIDSVPTWEAAFSQLGQIPCNGKRLIVIDEFPYMVEGDASIPSILQHLWDHELQKQNVMIVLCGSALAFMEKEVLSEKSPLFGRATRTIRVLPMDFADARLFFFDYSASDQVLAYSVLGGSPYCLQCFDPQASLKANVVRQLLSPRGFLWDFPQRAIIQECREPGRYNDIMRTIICGSRRFSEIAAKTVIESANLPRYLRVLSELGFVEREFPADHGIKEEANRQRGLYCLQDNLASFWYQYVWPNLAALTMGGEEFVWETQIAPKLNEIAAFPFEDVCRQYLWKLNIKHLLPFAARSIDRWWNKNEEIDLLAVPVQGDERLFGECKFRESRFDLGDLMNLKKKIELVPHSQAHFALFSKSGFTPAVEELARDPAEQITLFTLEDVVNGAEKRVL